MSRADIIEIVKALRRKVDFNRDTILAELSNNRGINLNIALDIAIQASCMTETGVTKKHTTYNKSLGAYWNGKESFVTYMDRSYPQTIDSEGIALTKTDQNALKGWKLAKKLGIKFKGTNNLVDHLFYSRQRNTLYIFHHVGFLNAHLGNRAYDIPLDSDMKTCLEIGTLPPRLLFETLHSIQSVLFPSMDLKAHKMMEQLVKKENLDPECNHCGGYKRKDLRRGVEEVQYKYWGERLVILQDLLRERPPTTKWEKWLQWQSSDTNAFAIAILALLISIIVGIISIGLSAVQIWIAWMAWKRPTQL